METTFTSSDDFFDWYLPKIKSFVPDLDVLAPRYEHSKIIQKIPQLTQKQIEYTKKKIREIAPIIDGVKLRYDSTATTWYSTINKSIEYVIGFPVYAFYMLKYPPVIRAAVEHELGHILNGDLEIQDYSHHQCLNITQDCRINDHIGSFGNREPLKDLYNSTYWFKTKTPEKEDDDLNVPEFYYPKVGLPYNKDAAGFSYQQIHDAYHRNSKEKLSSTEQPKTGDIVLIRQGKNSGKYGKVIRVDSSGKFDIKEMTKDEVSEHFKK